MSPKNFRLLLLAAGLVLFIGCESDMDYGEVANLHDSYTYRHPGSGYYDSWYGGGAYIGAGGYGGVGVGVSIPLNFSDDDD